jgi:diacylglycerol kinase (ATP)
LTGRLLVILNATAGGGSEAGVGDRRAAVRKALAQQDIDAEIFDSGTEDDTKRRIAEARVQGYAAIVAAGGDGTVRSVAFELLGSEVPLGILPMGTAMNVARSLEIPLDLDGAAAVLAAGHVRSVDVAFVGDDPFLEIATVGLAADMLEEATRMGEGRLRSAIDLVQLAARSRRTRVWLDLDGHVVRHRVTSLAIANGPFTGRALKAAPDARIDDGLLDVVCFLGFGPLDVVKQLARTALGLDAGPRTRTYRARRIRLRSHHPLPVRADSADRATTPMEVAVRPGLLRVVAAVTRPNDPTG